mgnify:CR=1 FL=1
MDKLEFSVEENNVANAIYSINEITDLNSLNEVASSLVSRRKELRAQEIKAKKAVISVGDKVKFEDKKGKEATGTLTKINRTKAIVKVRSAKRDDRGILTGARSVTWTVPITLLDLA